jgi:hypothetical protein
MIENIEVLIRVGVERKRRGRCGPVSTILRMHFWYSGMRELDHSRDGHTFVKVWNGV